MKPYKWLAVLFFSLFNILSASAETLTVATFNAEFLVPSKVHIKYGLRFKLSDHDQAIQDEWADPDFLSQKFEEATGVVADVLAQIETDVLTLTEVGAEAEVKQLVQAMKDRGADYSHMKVCDCQDNNTGQKVAVLSKLPIIDVIPEIPGREGYELEEDDPDEQEDTGVSKGMRVTVNKDGQHVHIYVLHLASERGGFEQDNQRVAQASIVRRHMLPALNAGEHVIVTGDLNDRRGQPTLRRIRGLDDMWPDLIQTGHWKFFEKGEEATRWTYEFRGENNQIDHILPSYSLRKKKKGSIHTSVIDIPKRENPSISDHRPMVVKIDLP